MSHPSIFASSNQIREIYFIALPPLNEFGMDCATASFAKDHGLQPHWKGAEIWSFFVISKYSDNEYGFIVTRDKFQFSKYEFWTENGRTDLARSPPSILPLPLSSIPPNKISESSQMTANLSPFFSYR